MHDRIFVNSRRTPLVIPGKFYYCPIYYFQIYKEFIIMANKEGMKFIICNKSSEKHDFLQY